MHSQRQTSRARLARKARAALYSALVGFALLQIVLFVDTTYFQPEIRDLEYGQRLHFLREQLAQNPGRPLLVVVGGSRTGIGLNPDALPPGKDSEPLLFNYGLDGADTILELLCLRRLLSDGIRPSWVVVEIMPPLLNQTQAAKEERWGKLLTRLDVRDLPLLWRYSEEPASWCLGWAGVQSAPCSTYRREFVKHYAPCWVPTDPQRGDDRPFQGRFGWRPHPLHPRSLAELESYVRLSWLYFAYLLVDFDVQKPSERPLHELLALCRQEQLPVSLLLMPEASVFRSWYPTETRHKLDQYLARLGEEFSAPVVDARYWVPDGGFIDGHHLSVDGAAQFTREFHRRVARPLAEGRLPREEPSQASERVVRQ